MFLLIDVMFYIIFLGIPLSFYRRSKKQQDHENRLHVMNVREDWSHYNNLICKLSKEIKDAEAKTKGPCSLVLLKQLEDFFGAKVEMDEIEKYIQDNEHFDASLPENKGKKRTSGVPRDLLLSTLEDNFIITKMHGITDVERKLQITEDNDLLLIACTESHIGLVVSAKGKKFIDSYGPYKERVFNKKTDKLIVVYGEISDVDQSLVDSVEAQLKKKTRKKK